MMKRLGMYCIGVDVSLGTRHEFSTTGPGSLKKQLQVRDYKVWDVNNGEDAIRIIRHKSPEVIIPDEIVPKMDGTETLYISSLRRCVSCCNVKAGRYMMIHGIPLLHCRNLCMRSMGADDQSN
jgi:hypothetical protein